MYELHWAQGSGAMASQALCKEIGAEYEKNVTDFENLDDRFATLDDALGPRPYLLGETYSSVEIMLSMLVQWRPGPASLSEEASCVVKAAERVHVRPAMAQTWQEHEEDRLFAVAPRSPHIARQSAKSIVQIETDATRTNSRRLRANDSDTFQ